SFPNSAPSMVLVRFPDEEAGQVKTAATQGGARKKGHWLVPLKETALGNSQLPACTSLPDNEFCQSGQPCAEQQERTWFRHGVQFGCEIGSHSGAAGMPVDDSQGVGCIQMTGPGC